MGVVVEVRVKVVDAVGLSVEVGLDVEEGVRVGEEVAVPVGDRDPARVVDGVGERVAVGDGVLVWASTVATRQAKRII